MEEIKTIDNTDNTDNNNNIDDTTPKKKYVFTEKRQAAFDRMRAARKQKIEEKRTRPIVLEKPKLKRSINFEQEEKKLSSSSSSSGTDSSNYESDGESKKIIISNYDINEPDSKIKITKIKRKNKINNEQLKKIFDEVNQEDSDSDVEPVKPIKKTRKQSQPKQQQPVIQPKQQPKKRAAKKAAAPAEPKIIYI